ncbi:MAG: flavodoxin family protein [Oscillospiraceae bacterium]|nr:flavodoxin family protein [Oscillospiraceae bacterium]
MKVIAINGSPRKQWNTHMLIEHAMNGAQSSGADVELHNLYDYNYKGCVSCFSCKTSYNSVDYCMLEDELMPLLKKIYECDAIILGSPMYLDSVTGEMRSFLERLWYPYMSYTTEKNSSKEKLKSLFIYTMNRSLDAAYDDGYKEIFDRNKRRFERAFGSSDYFVVPETYQWDYNIYPCTKFNASERIVRRKEIFPMECQKAYDMGKLLVSNNEQFS